MFLLLLMSLFIHFLFVWFCNSFDPIIQKNTFLNLFIYLFIPLKLFIDLISMFNYFLIFVFLCLCRNYIVCFYIQVHNQGQNIQAPQSDRSHFCSSINVVCAATMDASSVYESTLYISPCEWLWVWVCVCVVLLTEWAETGSPPGSFSPTV